MLLVAGDYDPAGRDIRERVAADVAAFADEHDVAIEVHAIALTLEQVEQLGLIKQPMDARKRAKHFDTGRWPHDWTVELEAMTPDQLARVIVKAIEDLTEADTRQAVLRDEAEQRAELMAQFEEGER